MTDSDLTTISTRDIDFDLGDVKVAVGDGAPAREKLTSRISRAVNDEIESTVDDPGQPRLL